MSGIPKIVEINSEEVREAIMEPVSIIIDAIKDALDNAPPELAGDIVDRGIVLTGGGSLINGAVDACKKSLALPVRIGLPSSITGLIDDVMSPAYSCAVGLLMYGLKQGNSETNSSNFPRINRISNQVKLGSTGRHILDFIKSFLP